MNSWPYTINDANGFQIGNSRLYVVILGMKNGGDSMIKINLDILRKVYTHKELCGLEMQMDGSVCSGWGKDCGTCERELNGYFNKYGELNEFDRFGNGLKRAV